jgi:hypothetical protein
MLKPLYFARLAIGLATTLVTASCSSDAPTSPSAVPRSLMAAAPTIALSSTHAYLCYPDRPASTRSCHPVTYVTISNTGGGTLNWTSTKSANASWLRRAPNYGTAPSTMKIRVDGTGLPKAYYYGRIYVWATGATNSPQTLYVRMEKW